MLQSPVHPIFRQTPAWPPAFFRMDREAMERLLGYFERSRHQSGETIFSPGDPANSLYYIIDGTLALVAEETAEDRDSGAADAGKAPKDTGKTRKAFGREVPAKGGGKRSKAARVAMGIEEADDEDDGLQREMLVGHAVSGEFVGDLGLFFPAPKRHIALRARTQAEIARISHARLMELLEGPLREDAPKVLYAIGAHLSKRLLGATRKASGLALVDVRERIMRAVIELAKHPDALTHPQGMQIKASRQELAKLSGCSREMAGRALKELEAAGRLTARGKTIVVFGLR